MSLNKWMYVEGNPVNRVDPTGLAPSQLGYFEGVSVTGPGFGSAAIYGSEIVYDYATMTRARFKYIGSLEGIYASAASGTAYFGGIIGFRYDDKLPIGSSLNPELPYSKKINEDYAGFTDGWYGGIGVSPIPVLPVSVSGGVGYFHSSNGYINGAFDYLSIGNSLTKIKFEGVTFHTLYDIDSGSLAGYNGTGIEYYYDIKTGSVNRSKLISDILTGDHSPILGRGYLNLFGWVGSSRNSQISIALIAARKFEKYYYQPTYGQCRPGQPDPRPVLPLLDPFPDPFPSLP